MEWIKIPHLCHYCDGQICMSTPKQNVKAYDDYVHVIQLLVLKFGENLYQVIDSIGINKRNIKNIYLENGNPNFTLVRSGKTLSIY